MKDKLTSEKDTKETSSLQTAGSAGELTAGRVFLYGVIVEMHDFVSNMEQYWGSRFKYVLLLWCLVQDIYLKKAQRQMLGRNDGLF